MKILHHFTENPLVLKPNKKYKQDDMLKPVGLWLSDENDHGWQKWCLQESFAIERLLIETKFECDLSKWLVLDTPKKLLDFSKKYGSKFVFSQVIDWKKVTSEYSGILITPYHWSLRHNPETFWYYGWDCASACVWDLSTIKQLK